MTQCPNPALHRRDVLRALTCVAAATAPLGPVVADSESDSEKRRPRYQPNSAEVQTFYRVNCYPAR